MFLNPEGYAPFLLPTGLTLQEWANRIKYVSLQAPTCRSLKNETVALQEFHFPVIRHYTDLTFYHATRSSLWGRIRHLGLLPSHQARALYGDRDIGWTQLNLHLQNGVYLTNDLDFARSIATTLAVRHPEEEGVVLEVPGALLRAKYLQVDEDSLRDPESGGLNLGDCRDDLPGYLTSLSERGCLAYRARIPAHHLRLVDRIQGPLD